MPADSHRIHLMDSRSLEERARGRPLLILPVGALEAHGPHLPLGSDLIQAEETAHALAERLGALVAPGLPYGVCPQTREFPGTVSLPMGTLARMVEDLLGEFHRSGFRRILVLSGHGAPAHMAALREAAFRAGQDFPDLRVAVLCDYELVYELRGTEAPESDGHAGFLETSRVLALAPELVGSSRPAGEYRVPRFLVTPFPQDAWTESVMGDPTNATPEVGRRVQAYVLDRLVEHIRAALPSP